MPVIVIGADTATGQAITTALLDRGGEVRAFATDPTTGGVLKAQGAKVAVGDLSDGSHVGAAAYQAFTAILMVSALRDGRSLAFATNESEVIEIWTKALRGAGVRRAIWIGDLNRTDVSASANEVTVVAEEGRLLHDLAREVADLNDRGRLTSET